MRQKGNERKGKRDFVIIIFRIMIITRAIVIRECSLHSVANNITLQKNRPGTYKGQDQGNKAHCLWVIQGLEGLINKSMRQAINKKKNLNTVLSTTFLSAIMLLAFKTIKVKPGQ